MKRAEFSQGEQPNAAIPVRREVVKTHHLNQQEFP